MEDALRAYDAGRADGLAGVHDAVSAGHPGTGADYRVGLADGQMAVFERDLIAAIRQALDTKKAGGRSSGETTPGDPGPDGRDRDSGGHDFDGRNEAR